MAAVGAEVSGLLTSGVFGFFLLLLLLSIFLTALCSECSRRSFELRDSTADREPSSLIRVVKLEDAMVARENPMIGEIQYDEKEFNPSEGSTVSVSPWRSHLGELQNHQDVQTNGSAVKTESDSESAKESNPEEETSTSFTLWRSHLHRDVHSPPPPDHIYHTIGGGGGGGGGGGRSRSDADLSSAPTNQEPGEERSAAAGEPIDRNSVYAQVSKKARPTTPPAHTPEEAAEQEESSPPLPDRKSQLEDERHKD
ncbi:uncharacterized protein LOC115005805 isoform X1 [Cottoperca gobio]|uniref:Uncharacterized protein LOC115005805 isoform X1 n=1 Tax=Cottoperca gobio TaxID=56716 RepID=A0A6J2PDY5_COTGO|nr:uncharacterized protein LOC115005805 isoform X1 [Cottoperca gobio]XP_029283607.1 uncharacterized protein LOC115005805 isoform X1 [Cottoperca gobio]XP_029283608.1 uncharacterized protein LOC115005805 isoform X1 [Cottoperca gobio]XP_029283609.1 uncharacterized protein LOC115005805 isoform X1 [Cottoperca gobio]